MGYISTIFVHKVATLSAARASAGHARRRDLCRSAGVNPDTPPDQKSMIRDTAFFELLERVAHEDQDGRSIAVRVGSSMCCDDYGAFGLAFKSAIDLFGSFQRVERFGKVVTSTANFTVNLKDGSAFMAVRPDKERRLGFKMTNELAVSAATALSREVCTKDFSPVSVWFSHEEPEDVSAQHAHFRCPVHYGADRDGLEISTDLLRTGNRLGDAGISRFFDTHVEKELAEFVDDTKFDQRVRAHIAQALSEGVPVVSAIAERMGMSGRSLQRRLSEHGYVYQELVDSARRDLAERLLGQSEFAIVEIAFLTGYSDQSTFTRAFKRWHGQTPANYRRTVIRLT